VSTKESVLPEDHRKEGVRAVIKQQQEGGFTLRCIDAVLPATFVTHFLLK